MFRSGKAWRSRRYPGHGRRWRPEPAHRHHHQEQPSRGSTDIGLREQVSRGIMGAMLETLSQRRATKASKAINALLDGNDVEALLAAARALPAQEASASSSQPQDLPSTSRAAPPRREHVSAPSSPNRSRLGQTSNEITRSKSARDLGMELHQFARMAGKHAKDLM